MLTGGAFNGSTSSDKQSDKSDKKLKWIGPVVGSLAVVILIVIIVVAVISWKLG